MTLNIEDDISCYGGCVGAVHLFEESPRLNSARVRPFVAAILLLRGAVREREVLATVTQHSHPDDLKSWDSEATQAELVVTHAIRGLVTKGILRERDDGLFVLASTPQALQFAISACSALDAQLPDHLLQEAGARYFSPPSHD